MVRRAAVLPLVLLAIGACGPRVRGSRSVRSRPTATVTPTATTATPTATATATATATTATVPTAAATTTATATTAAPTVTATATAEPPPVADDLVPACRFNCEALRNVCAAGDASGCYKLCDEYDRTLARGCRGLMATYFRCLAWTASCDGGQPRSDASKCAADKAALDACKG